jgi:hypothetical protein
MTIFHGTRHDDTFNESSDTTSDTFDLFKGGEDTAIGGSGDDRFNMGASLDAGDRLDGGDGRDVVFLRGDYSAGVVLQDQTIQNIESIRLGRGFDYKLTLADGNVAAGAKLTVDAAALGAGNSLHFDGSAETDGSFKIMGGAGNDLLIGGAGNDVFIGGAGADVLDLSHGGHDNADGGTGDDTFDAGAALTAGDIVNGGAGNDTLVLSGDYSDGLILGAATIQQVETLKFDAGHDYNLTSNDANVAIHATLIVDASALGPHDTVSFVGTAETNGSFVFMGGKGGNFFSGGSGVDQFDFVASKFNEGTGGGGNDIFSFGGDNANVDQIDGGSGSNTLVFAGNYTSLSLADSAVANIQTIFFEGSDTYSAVAISGDISAAAPITIRADVMLAGGSLALDASASSNAIHFTGGAGSYTLVGSGQSDTFDAGAGFTGFDSIDGGGGNDTLALDGDYNFFFAPSAIKNIETITLAAGHDYNLTTSDDNVAAGQTLTIDGSALGAGDSLTFFGTGETDGGSFHIVSRAGSAFLVGGAGNDTFDLGAAAFSPNVHVDGGAGTDTVILDGVYAPGTDVGPLATDSIERVKLAAGHSYDLAESGPFFVKVIDASALGAGDTLTFDGSSANTGFTIVSGAGADQITVSTTADFNIFDYTGIALSGATRDTIVNFNTSGHDVIAFHTVNAVDSFVFGGTLDNANFDSDLASDIGAAQLHAGDAVLFEPDSGDLAVHQFLIVDGNGVAGYQAGSDLVIDITNGNLALTTANFIG